MTDTPPTTAVIADDEPALAQALQRHLASLWPGLTIAAVARNGLEAATAIRELAPDVAFLDIQMPGLTGLEVAQGIENPGTHVVFVTAFDEFAVQAFEAERAGLRAQAGARRTPGAHGGARPRGRGPPRAATARRRAGTGPAAHAGGTGRRRRAAALDPRQRG